MLLFYSTALIWSLHWFFLYSFGALGTQKEVQGFSVKENYVCDCHLINTSWDSVHVSQSTFYCCMNLKAPENLMGWQCNNIGRWQKALKREAERAAVCLTWGHSGFWGLSCRPWTPKKMSESQQGGNNAISQKTASVNVERYVTHCIIYFTQSYCT